MMFIVAEKLGKFVWQIEQMPCGEFDEWCEYLCKIKPDLMRRANKS